MQKHYQAPCPVPRMPFKPYLKVWVFVIIHQMNQSESEWLFSWEERTNQSTREAHRALPASERPSLTVRLRVMAAQSSPEGQCPCELHHWTPQQMWGKRRGVVSPSFPNLLFWPLVNSREVAGVTWTYLPDYTCLSSHCSHHLWSPFFRVRTYCSYFTNIHKGTKVCI